MMAAAAAAAADPSTTTTLVEIVPGPIDVSRYVGHVRDPSAGAIATFEGTTRDTFDGKRVVELRYEAYASMAVRQLRSILTTALSRWPELRRIAAAHRVGAVPVGEASVFVAASAVHRADALEACRFVIDEVKASVPVWKKEVYEDGDVWKENPEFMDKRKRFLLMDHDGAAAAMDNKSSSSPPSNRSCCCGPKARVVKPVGDDDEEEAAGKIRGEDAAR